jgi:hypothetical protein
MKWNTRNHRIRRLKRGLPSVPDAIAVTAVWLAAGTALQHAHEVSALWLLVSAVSLWAGGPKPK